MADQGLWFKLWLGFDEDPDLGNLNDKDLLSWILLGCYLKKHGNEGMTCLSKPAVALQRKMRIEGYENLLTTLLKFPNIEVHEKQKDATDGPVALTVEWKNWHKYQSDYSTIRSRLFRDRQRFKKRREGEEKENEKKKRFIPPTPAEIAEFVKAENLKIDPQRFHNHYEANGWRVGKNPMKNWKATARNWKPEESFNATANKPANAFVARGTESSKYDDIGK